MKILICGASTYGNMGDDAIRNIIVRHLEFLAKDLNIDIEVKVTRPYPQEHLIRWADKVIIGGGGILYDTPQSNFDYYFNNYFQWCLDWNRPVCLCGIGTGVIKGDQSKIFIFENFPKAKFISVRQQQDKDFLESLGVDCTLADDLGFLMNPTSYKFIQSESQKKFCIIPRIEAYNHNPEEYMKSMKWLVDELKAKDFEVYTTSTAYEDLSLVVKIKEFITEHDSVRSFRYLTAEELTSVLGQMDYIFSGRLHGLIFGYANNCKRLFTAGKASKLTSLIPESNNIHNAFWNRDPIELFFKLENFELPNVNYNSFKHLDLLTQFVKDEV